MIDINAYINDKKQAIDLCLNSLLPKVDEQPTSIHKAIRYCVCAGGKRLRPILVLASGEAVHGEENILLPVACAIEMIHTYSLIHDDLPALDNDDLRRGRPTCHKAFGEAIAILAGDALLTLAFQVLASLPTDERNTKSQLELIKEIARAAGTRSGMIGGQVVDLESEGKQVDKETLEFIHNSKTASLFAAAVNGAAIMAGASPEQRALLYTYGKKIGLAFQIIDDILDIEASSEKLGKTAGKDEKQSKATYPKLWGMEKSKRRAIELIDSAIENLRPLNSSAEILIELASLIKQRIPKKP